MTNAKVQNNKSFSQYFLLLIIGYHAFWYVTFSFIFRYQFAVKYANNIAFGKLIGELFLYTVFVLYVVFFNKTFNKVSKFCLACVALSLSVFTAYASLKYI